MDESAKSFAVGVMATLASILSPIQNVLIVLSVTFVFNIWIGISADKIVNNVNFSVKKAFSAFMQMAITMFFVYYTYMVFEQFEMDKLGKEVVKWISLLAVYFYATNIVRNISDIYPRNKFYSFAYDVLTTHIFSVVKNNLFSALKIDKKVDCQPPPVNGKENSAGAEKENDSENEMDRTDI